MMNEAEFRNILFLEYRETLFELIDLNVRQSNQEKGEMLRIAELLKSRTENALRSRI